MTVFETSYYAEVVMELWTWPDKAIAPPRLYVRSPECELVDVGGEPVIMQRGNVHAVAKYEPDRVTGEWLPPEMYLWEVHDLDLEDAEAVRMFVQTWGAVRLKHMGDALLKAHRRKLDSHRRKFAKLAKLAREAGYEGDALAVAEVRLVIQIFRDAVRGFLWDSGTITLDELMEGQESPIAFSFLDGIDIASWRRMKREHQRRGVAGFSLSVINAGLETWTPRITMNSHLQPNHWTSNIYSAWCLQLFNTIAEGDSFRVCQRCGRVFVRQRGRAKQGQHRRSGEIVYCSVRCANAATVAAFRQRQKAEREGRSIT